MIFKTIPPKENRHEAGGSGMYFRYSGRLGVQGQRWLHNQFKVGISYVKPCLKTSTTALKPRLDRVRPQLLRQNLSSVLGVGVGVGAGQRYAEAIRKLKCLGGAVKIKEGSTKDTSFNYKSEVASF